MNKYGYLLVTAVAVAAVAGGSMYVNDMSVPMIGQTPTGQLVQDTYELATGSDLEVMKVEDLGSLDRVVLSDGSNVLNAHITNDGQYIVRNLVHVENYTKTLEARNEFISCLEDQNANFYGIMAGNNQNLSQHTRMAQLQIQVLGGQNGLQNVFAGPGTEGFPQQQVMNNGVVWRLNGETQTGIKTIPQLEEATGCSYNAPGS